MKKMKMLVMAVSVLMAAGSFAQVKGNGSIGSATSQQLDYQVKYICANAQTQDMENVLEFVLSYESRISLESLSITKLKGHSVNIKADLALMTDRYFSPETEVFNLKINRNETGENLITIESTGPDHVVANDGQFNKFNANIRINDGSFLGFACHEVYKNAQ